MMEIKKERLDVLLVKLGVASSREKAKNLILEGSVCVNDAVACKPSALFNEDAKIKIDEKKPHYVSRGGFKLEKAINSFKISVKGLCCMDIGASTGGFTDVLLKNGAAFVYAVDVGSGQLDESLRRNKKVENLEKTNIRNLEKSRLNHEIDFFTADVSFISLSLVLPEVKRLVSESAEGVCLIKPQFEAGRGAVGKRGVVKDVKIHEKVINSVCGFCISNGFSVLSLDFSPVKGPEGNIEYLAHFKVSENPVMNPNLNIKKLVDLSHKNFKNKAV